MKYYIKSTNGNYFSNKLKFNTEFEDVMIFDNAGEAKEAMILYGLDNCAIRPCTLN